MNAARTCAAAGNAVSAGSVMTGAGVPKAVTGMRKTSDAGDPNMQGCTETGDAADAVADSLSGRYALKRISQLSRLSMTASDST